jgi:hypothetical protein
MDRQFSQPPHSTVGRQTDLPIVLGSSFLIKVLCKFAIMGKPPPAAAHFGGFCNAANYLVQSGTHNQAEAEEVIHCN